MKKLLSIMLVLTMALTLLAGCGGSGSSSTPAASSGSTAGSSSAPAEQTLKVAAIETAYGSDMWKEVCAAFEAANPGVTVELTTEYEGRRLSRRHPSGHGPRGGFDRNVH